MKTAFGGVRPDLLASPWTDAQLPQFAITELFSGFLPDGYTLPMTRAEAMRIPAVSKARVLVTNTIGRLPLRSYSSDGTLTKIQPTWTYRTDGTLPPFLRLVWTLDDLLFYGSSLWQGVKGSDGFFISLDRVPWEWWEVTPEGVILINGEPADADEIIYFPPFIEGLLERATVAMRQSANIQATVAARIASPIPAMEIAITEDVTLSDQEQKDLVAAYIAARRDGNGAVVLTPYGVELKPHGDKADLGFMSVGRNDVRLDIANLTGLPASLLEGSVATASLTYSTQVGRRNELFELGLGGWVSLIESRLSQNDVTPNGQEIRFDLSGLIDLNPETVDDPQLPGTRATTDISGTTTPVEPSTPKAA